jgi:hypothetical protein
VSDAIDVLTDLSPAPQLAGWFRRTSGRAVAIVVQNTGDARMRAGSVQVFACTGRRIDRDSTLLGNTLLPQGVAHGALVGAPVSLSYPKDIAAGQYNLIAVYQSGHKLTPFAITENKVSLQATAPASTGPAAAPMIPANVFSTGPAASADAWAFDQPLDTLAGG